MTDTKTTSVPPDITVLGAVDITADAATFLRLGIAEPRDGIVEIVSVPTGTTLLLPFGDINLLIEGLQNLGRPAASQRTIFLDPSKGSK